jgi:hypothetical protein
MDCRENGASGRETRHSSCHQPGNCQPALHSRSFKTYGIPINLANLSRPSICNGKNLDQLGILDFRCRSRGEERLQVHVPVGAQPDQTLRRDDRSTPNERPFLTTNMLAIQIFRDVVSEEDGPDDRKRPDIGMEVERYCQAVRNFWTLPSRKRGN